MRCAALYSGGKESAYSMYKVLTDMRDLNARIERLIFLRPRRPSPHELNIHIVYLQSKLMGVSLTVWDSDSIGLLLDKLKVDCLVAGDVLVLDHVMWLVNACRDHGVPTLIEPLFNYDTRALIREIVESGFEFIVIGAKQGCEKLVGLRVSRESVDELISITDELEADPCGEHGEYHTLVLRSPLMRYGIDVTDVRRSGQSLAIRGFRVI